MKHWSKMVTFPTNIKMEFYKGLFLLAFVVGCTAIPTPQEDDLSIFFEHADRSARIVGGSQAPAGSHPHMVAMTNGLLVRSFLCGGSVVTPRTVLTAAHCIEAVFSWGSLSNNLRLTVGTNRWNSGGQTYSVTRNITHPNYLPSPIIKNDLGILLTSSNIVLSSLVQPIALNYNFVGANVPLRVAGWGRIRAGGSLSATLLEITANTIDGQRCIADAEWAAIEFNFRNAPAVEPHIEICTFHSAGRGTCNGDSGSALARTDNGQQVGIVSWGFPCALGAPDVFVRVSAYRDWLLQNIA